VVPASVSISKNADKKRKAEAASGEPKKQKN